MRITHLSLTNFRNYGRLEVDFSSGATLLHGDNAQGKTNLLEALYYLATTRSPHANHDGQLINWDAEQTFGPLVVGRLVADVETARAKRQIEIRLIREYKNNGKPSFRREALINRRKVRLMDLLGQLQVVLFLPEDVQLITGSPAGRRRYVNITLCQIDSHYCRVLSQYNKVLEQRNAVLRQLAEGQSSLDVLAIFSEKLVGLGGQIFARRSLFFAAINRETQRIHYENLTQGRETLQVRYLPRFQAGQDGSDLDTAVAHAEWLAAHQTDVEAVTAKFAAELKTAQPHDLARGVTTVGPHRDDWYFWLNGRHLGHYGSRGQQRSAMLALKMAEINWMESNSGEPPVLLLDEVVAELDAQRRSLLLQYVQRVSQAILTATDPAMFPIEFLEQTRSMLVENGRVAFDESGFDKGALDKNQELDMT